MDVVLTDAGAGVDVDDAAAAAAAAAERRRRRVPFSKYWAAVGQPLC